MMAAVVEFLAATPAPLAAGPPAGTPGTVAIAARSDEDDTSIALTSGDGGGVPTLRRPGGSGTQADGNRSASTSPLRSHRRRRLCPADGYRERLRGMVSSPPGKGADGRPRVIPGRSRPTPF
jgi:hypothetical protein